MKPLSPETLIQDRYKIVHLIGKGGMGEVYLAVDQRLGSAVALKRTFFSDDDLLATAFEREARILANLRHPILPKVSDHFIDGDNQYLVMEHISGDDLSKRLEKTQQSFPLSWVLFWADQLLDALNYLHTHEPPIIHRDIKPQNLKLTGDNQIVLLDFGLSKNSLGETKFSSTGSTGSVVGYTPHYAPMEQIRGTGTSSKSDIYSLSSTLYQLLTNSVPPDALTRADSLLNGLADPIKPINELNKEVTPEISKVILKGMEVSQDKRYPTAREMQRVLRDAYAKLQNVMSAKTVAFNLDTEQADLGNQAASIPVADDSEFPIHSAETQTGYPEDRTDSSGMEDKNVIFAPDSELQEPDFDATIRYDDEYANVSSKQSDVKTEVFLAGGSPAISAAQESNDDPFDDSFTDQDNLTAQNNYSTNDHLAEDDFFADEKVDEDEKYSPDATVPLINFDKSDGEYEEQIEDSGSADIPDDTDFFSMPSSEMQESGDETESFAAFEDEPVGQETQLNVVSEAQPPAPVVSPVSAKKEGKSKALPIILGLGAVFVLIIGAVAGVSWYMLSDGNTFGLGDDNTPTPEASVEKTSTPEPTREEVINNTNELDNTNESDNTNEGNTEIDNTNTSKTPEKTTTPRPTRQKPPPTRKTPVPRTPPPRTPPPTQKPPTPREKPTIKQ